MKTIKIFAVLFVLFSALSLYAQVPDSPILVRPPKTSTGVSTTPTFYWSDDSKGTMTFELQLSTSSDFSSILMDVSGIQNTQYGPVNTLMPNTTYYWRVNATNTYGTSNWSTVFSFTTGS